jgi:tetratricopeptide (TPR) repeat protein
LSKLKYIFIILTFQAGFLNASFSNYINYARKLSANLNAASFEKAENIYQKLFNRDKDAKTLYFRIKNLLEWAEYLFRAKRYKTGSILNKALLLLNQASRLFPGNTDFILLKATYNVLISKRSQGCSLLLGVYERYKDKPYFIYLLWKYKSPSPDPFSQDIEKVIQLKPGFLKARFDRARELFNRGVLHDALSEAKYLASRMTLSPWVLTFLGVCYLEHNDPHSAIVFFKKALNIEDYSPAVFEMGRSLYLYGKLEESLPYFENTLKLNKAHASAHYYSGKAYMILGKKKKAYYHFTNYLKYCPSAVDRDDIIKWLKRLSEP